MRTKKVKGSGVAIQSDGRLVTCALQYRPGVAIPVEGVFPRHQLKGKAMHVGWKASLSNGETLYDGKGDYVPDPQKLSPWNRLMAHMKADNLTMTSLALYVDDGRVFHLPSAGNNPRFPALAKAPVPNRYNFFYASVSAMGISEHGCSYSVVEAIYDDHKLQIWVDRENPDNSWSLMVEA